MKKGFFPHTLRSCAPLPYQVASLRLLLHKLVFVNIRKQFLIWLAAKSTRHSLGGLMAGMGLTILWDWHWQLVLATGVGAGSMLSVYRLLDWDWGLYWQKWQRFSHKPQGKLTLAASGGGLAALGSFMAATLLTDTENPAVAIALGLQVVMSGAILCLLLAQVGSRQPEVKREELGEWLLALSDGNPLRRLIAVRHLARLSQKTGLEQAVGQQIAEYFQFMLNQEEHPQVREALLASWGENRKPLEVSPSPLTIPIKLAAENPRINKITNFLVEIAEEQGAGSGGEIKRLK